MVLDPHDADKRLAALAAADEVQDGMVVGLGTGSTAAHLIARLGERVRDEGLRITGVATSDASAALATRLGIPCRDLSTDGHVDLTIDGADEIDPRLYAIKGAGGAMLREKIVATAATRMVVIADGSKWVESIGAAKLPVEFELHSEGFVRARLEALGATPARRERNGAPYVTDLGNRILDCTFPRFPEPLALAAALDAIPGAFGHGLFVREVAAVYVAQDNVVRRVERQKS